MPADSRSAAAALASFERLIDPPDDFTVPPAPPVQVTDRAELPRTPTWGLDPFELEELLLALDERAETANDDGRARIGRVRARAERELAELIAA